MMPKILITKLFILSIIFGLNAQSITQEKLPMPTGEDIVRCYSDEYNHYLEDKNPNRANINEFESWMSAQRQELEVQRASQRSSEDPVVYTIPTIIHVIHRGEAVGTMTNIAPELVYDQIEQLNRDFRKIVGTMGESDYIDAADTQVEFCPALYDEDGNELAEPGINRINALTHIPPLGPGVYTGIVEFDDVVKRNTFWDPELYMNFWSADIGPVLLGYAQFPDAPCLGGIGTGNGDAETDGIVCNYNAIGGEIHKASNAPYDLGRTATHEVGHWIGLRHIWGDTGCGGDDFVEDTPNAADSNGGCATTANSCDDSGNDYFAASNPNPYDGPADPNDQVQNYMDYSADACMNIFTNVQRDRMRIVMGELTGRECEGGSPRRASLALSNKCTPVNEVIPRVAFKTTSTSVKEGTACNLQTTNITLDITNAPDADVTVTANVTGGTAVEGVDYVFTNNTAVFTAGSTAEQTIQIDIVQDGALETEKDIQLAFTLSAGTVEISPIRPTHTVKISDDDVEPQDGKNIAQDLIYTEDFEGVDAGDDWGTSFNDPATVTSWIVGESGGLSTNSAYISTPFLGYTYTDTPTGNVRYESPVFDATGATNITLTFDVMVGGESSGGTNYDYGTTWFCTDGTGTAWTKFGDDLLGIANGGVRTFTLPVDADNAATLQVAFQWQSDETTANTPPLSFDNVEVRGDYGGSSDIVTATGATDEITVKANQTVYFYDANKNIIAAIENGATDLECMSATTLTNGAEANIDLSALGADSEGASKTFMINADGIDSPTASYKVWLYYTDAEIDAWLTNHATAGLTIDDFKLFKTSAATAAEATDANTVSSATIYEAYTAGSTSGYRFSGDFSGFSVFGGFNGSLTLPLDLIGFTGAAEDKTVELKWLTTNEIDVDYFVVERQTNNIFKAMGSRVAAKGSAQNTYNSTDAQPQIGDNFYRLKIVDQNGKYKYSNVINVSFVSNEIVSNIFPNPATNQVFISLNAEIENPVVKVFNQLGQTVAVAVLNRGNQLELNTQNLSNGVYYIELTNNATTNLHSIVINK